MKSTLLALSVAMAVGLGVSACGEKKTEAAAGENGAVTVKIGQSSPLTGPQAHIGKDNDNGVRLAID